MPGFLIDQKTQIKCMHGGTATATSPVPKVLVMKSAVVTQPPPHTVAGCPFTTPPGAPMPCVTAVWSKAASKVLATKQPVLLADSTATCAPNGTGVVIVPSQIKVSAR